MKKSKIIVPALGLLLLSTAASVSGTVAWFTANRTFTTSAGNFAVVRTNTDLACTLTAGVGTRVVGSGASATIALADDYVELTDGSFDHDAKNIFAPNADGVKVGKVTALDTNPANAATLATALLRAQYNDAGDNTHKVYTAATWTMDFNVSYTAAGSNSGLFIDQSITKFTKPDGTALTEAGKGFRLAFIPFTESDSAGVVYQTGNTRVLARAQSSSATWDHDNDAETAAVPSLRYIKNAALNDDLNTKASTYATPILMDSAYSTALPDDNAINTTTALARVDCLGKFTAVAATTVHLKFAVVAWYEGTDEFVVNSSALLEKVKASMSFELRTLLD